IVLLIAILLGADPRQLGNLFPGGGGGGGGGEDNNPPAKADPEEERQASFTKVILHDTEVVWEKVFRKMGKEYRKPTLVLFSGRVESAGGLAAAAVGPFYCPADEQVYIDLSFYRDMEKKLNAPGEFARAYVIAHEVGHHVQHLLGEPERIRARGGTKNEQSVRQELQADFLAGVWANHAQ